MRGAGETQNNVKMEKGKNNAENCLLISRVEQI